MANKIITCSICGLPYAEKVQQKHYLVPGHLERDKTRELILSSFDSLRDWFVIPAYRVPLLERSGVSCRYIMAKQRNQTIWLTTALPCVLSDFCLQSLVMTPGDTQNTTRLDWCRVPYDPADKEAAVSELTQSDALSSEFTKKLGSKGAPSVYVNELYYRLEDFMWRSVLSRIGHDLTSDKENSCFPGVRKPGRKISDPENMRYLLRLLAYKKGQSFLALTRFDIATLYRHYYRALILPSPYCNVCPEWFINNLDEMSKRGYLRWEPKSEAFTVNVLLLNHENAQDSNAVHFSGICYDGDIFKWNPPEKSLIDLDNRLDKRITWLKIHDECTTPQLKAELAYKERERRASLRRAEKQLKSAKFDEKQIVMESVKYN